MPRSISQRRNGVSRAGIKSATPIPASAVERSPSERIREAEELIRQLLLEDDFNEDQREFCLMPGTVTDQLDQVLMVLSSIAGQQELFELWISR